MNNPIITERLDRLRQVMRKNGVDWYLVPTADFHHSEYVDGYFKVREYLSNFSGSNGSLIVGPSQAGLWTDGRYFIQAAQELEGTGIKLYRMQEEGVPTLEAYLAKQMREGETLGFDGRVVDTRLGQRLEKALQKKKIRFSCDRDLADAVWTNRPPLPCHPVIVLDEKICGETVGEKLKRVRKEMEKLGAAGHFLSRLDDLMWLFNIRGRDVACNPVALSYAWITKTECHLFLQKEEMTDALYAHADRYGIVLHEYWETADFLSACPIEGKILCDAGQISYAFYRLLTNRAGLILSQNPTERMKAVKNPVEIACMREVYEKDSAIVCQFLCWVKKNIGRLPMTELSAGRYLDDLRRSAQGFWDLSFPTICAYGPNAAMMHYEADETHNSALKEEGLLLVDSGGQYLGGTTDVTRTIALGRISQKMKAHYTAVATGMLRLMNARFLFGCSGRNLDILARQPLWEQNMDYKCGTGHGVGYMLNVHEGPQSIRWRFAKDAPEAEIEAGMVVTDEPGVYLEGEYGIRIENVLLAVNGEKNGDGQFMHFETLTYVPIDRDAIDPSLMRQEDIALLNRYHALVREKITPYLDREQAEWLARATREI